MGASTAGARQHSERRRKHSLLGVGLTLWIAAVLAAFAGLSRYAGTPGEPAQAPPHWPSASSLALAPDRPTLLLFAHPRCPCTRATLEVLDREMARWDGAASVTLVFYAPSELPGDEARAWARSDSWKRAEAIPGVAVRLDAGGIEARCFGAGTSGETLLYGPGGELRFAGGLTPARGHEGPSRGTAALNAALASGARGESCSPVFGCALVGADRVDSSMNVLP